jgi:nucleoside-triphosphatase THEP1
MSSTTALHQKRFVLTGMGGQGKSEICLRVVNEVRESYVTLAFTQFAADLRKVLGHLLGGCGQ